MAFSSDPLILINANIYTLNPSLPKADWLFIDKGQFVKIGHGKEWRPFRSRRSRIINCERKTLLPGFIDTHVHLISQAKSYVSLNFSSKKNYNSIIAVQSAIQNCAINRNAGKWIFGFGYNEFYLAEGRHPTRWDLDQAAPNHPVKLTHRSGHAHVLNSLALKLVGITKYTGDPDGSLIERDLTTGEPTGLLHEMGNFLSDRIPRITAGELEKGLRMANDAFLSWGITSLQDASYRNDAKRVMLVHSWLEAHLLKPRVNMMLGFKTFKEKDFQSLFTQLKKSRCHVTTIKIILDDTTGNLHPSLPKLKEMVYEIHKSGLQVAIHTIGESTLEAACSAVQFALDALPKKNHRHRIEHCSVCPPHLAKQMKHLDMMVVTQPSFIYYQGERYLKTVPDEQLKHLYPIKTLLHHGIRVAGSSDCPIAPPNPLIGMYAAISRKNQAGEFVGKSQNISVMSALRMYTQNGAYALFEETVKGSISPGKVADLVILNGDPMRLPHDELLHLQVDMTIIGGEVVWTKDG